MTTDEIKALIALAEAATPGPWSISGRTKGTQNPEISGPLAVELPNGKYIASVFITAWRQDRRTAQPDAAFIAAARDAVPRLCAEVLRAREALRQTLKRAASVSFSSNTFDYVKEMIEIRDFLNATLGDDR